MATWCRRGTTRSAPATGISKDARVSARARCSPVPRPRPLRRFAAASPIRASSPTDMPAVKAIRSRTVVLPTSNIDTDQIIPARFLTSTSRAGFGKNLFADWRYDSAGNLRPDFALNKPEAGGAQILVAGRNFGCGSSREHAAWALQDFGFAAVISTEFAD